MLKLNEPLILVVDDVPGNLQLLARILRKENYQIALADNGKKALSIIDKKKPALILLDIMMPFMDGFEVCKYLKADDETKDIPIIFISALDDVQKKVKAFKIGGVDYITKPFIKEEVLARIRTHIAIDASRKEINNLYESLNEQIKQAKYLHEQFLPTSLPNKIGYKISSYYHPADNIGGDFYQFNSFNKTKFFYLSDVIGHGLDGALVNIFTREQIYYYLMKQISNDHPINLSELLNVLNKKFINQNFPEDYYSCLIIGTFDVENKQITLANAGIHKLPLIIRKNGEVESIDIIGRPIGLFQNFFEYKTCTFEVADEDKLFISSDGIYDLVNKKANQYSDSLINLIKTNSLHSGLFLTHLIKKNYMKFIDYENPNDDITYFFIEDNDFETEKISFTYWKDFIHYLSKTLMDFTNEETLNDYINYFDHDDLNTASNYEICINQTTNYISIIIKCPLSLKVFIFNVFRNALPNNFYTINLNTKNHHLNNNAFIDIDDLEQYILIEGLKGGKND